eukprot:1162121-Pelagomonas_calceolata.AAC.2
MCQELSDKLLAWSLHGSLILARAIARLQSTISHSLCNTPVAASGCAGVHDTLHAENPFILRYGIFATSVPKSGTGSRVQNGRQRTRHLYLPQSNDVNASVLAAVACLRFAKGGIRHAEEPSLYEALYKMFFNAAVVCQVALAAVQSARDMMLAEDPSSLPAVVEIACEACAGGAPADEHTAGVLSESYVNEHGLSSRIVFDLQLQGHYLQRGMLALLHDVCVRAHTNCSTMAGVCSKTHLASVHLLWEEACVCVNHSAMAGASSKHA